MKKILKVALAFVLAFVSGRFVGLSECKAASTGTGNREMTELQKQLAEKGALNDPGTSTNSVRCHQ